MRLRGAAGAVLLSSVEHAADPLCPPLPFPLELFIRGESSVANFLATQLDQA